MSNLVYHSNESESNKQSFKEFDNVDFLINVGGGRALVKNSVRVVGDLYVSDTGAGNPPNRASGNVYFNRKCGAHAFIESVQVQFTEGPAAGNVENLDNYARYVNMVVNCSQDQDDLLNGLNVCELKAPNNYIVDLYSSGTKTKNAGGGTQFIDDANFSIKPLCCLNSMAMDDSSGDLAYSKTGSIKLSLNLAKNLSALKGQNQVLGSMYELKNLKVTYNSVPISNNNPCNMGIIYNYKGSILSNFSNVSAKVPAACNSVSVSFQEQARENVIKEDNYELHKCNGISEVSFLFNDSTNEFITYKINDIGDMQKRFIDSLSASGHNQVNGGKANSNDATGLGLDFRNYVDLSTQKFNIQIKSKIDGTNPLNAYMYFHSMISV